MPTAPGGFKGNKAALPVKICVVCGRAMSWRKKWARNWESVRICSTACQRRRKSPDAGAR